ncbi:MAG: non-canonical purine NTP pyrophosphatase, RdgB/HAM1 family [Ignavibacteria bacterium GWB2_35_12]|nr:MAG: non-canonical purine NTP pyrophosphatase, RdgB/HAM1 family [Ignavibacteria bacterium GWA2_35_8]OGU40883.1 MAG: non-canonical purine NTP pyrophosphatase, RdgB/HAM1 family [Ignavibacteria bacterium GWB2_35_12]OGU96325.1 MAG: non-canonical purine NTP pyrophosphatase, RdgB/HAM1 family [Ignavibacteria bacterium RIFOXYA2_FULL_35_10]OGV24694.1 MAG: non-canonical purine NTP pyrophosphatase, RdgB/HAM1 family [Ignavibacteria bacterium RIFOXYC2_FULL_35_21]
MKLLIGTNNQNKVREIKEILDREFPRKFVILTPADVLDNQINIEETGKTLEENAYLKSSEFYSLTKIPSISDDTGLEIEALKGEPGVNSARYSGEHSNDAENRKKVLNLLNGNPVEKRKARFRTVICYVEEGKTEYIEGICSGRIIEEERGTSGFGYDSIFVPDGYVKTFAEMTAEEKNILSHRGKAVRNLVEFLKTL